MKTFSDKIRDLIIEEGFNDTAESDYLQITIVDASYATVLARPYIMEPDVRLLMEDAEGKLRPVT